jgi:hypothetical protein
MQILSTSYHGYDVEMKDGLPESKRRNVATLIMMGNERERDRKETDIHAKTGGPPSLLCATSMRRRKVLEQNFCISFSLSYSLHK